MAGLIALAKGALGAAGADHATLARGASGNSTCNTGYTLSRTQPSCRTEECGIGSVTCAEATGTVAGLIALSRGALDAAGGRRAAGCRT